MRRDSALKTGVQETPVSFYPNGVIMLLFLVVIGEATIEVVTFLATIVKIIDDKEHY